MPKQEQPQPKPLTEADFNKLEVKFTDAEVQFVANSLVRKDRIIAQVNNQFAEELQHFAVLVAKKKNIQFAENLFAGVSFDTKKQKAYIMLHKTDPAKKSQA